GRLGRWRDARGLDARLREGLVEVRRPVRNTVLLGDLLGRLGAPARQARDLDAFDVPQPIEMLPSECALPDDDDLHSGLLFVRWTSPERVAAPAARHAQSEAKPCSTGRAGSPVWGSM